MQIQESSNEMYLVLTIQGSITNGEVNNIADRLQAIIKQGRSNIVLDLTGVNTIDSSALGLLVEYSTKVNLCIYGLNKDIMDTFHLTGMQHILNIYPHEQDFLENIDNAF